MIKKDLSVIALDPNQRVGFNERINQFIGALAGVGAVAGVVVAAAAVTASGSTVTASGVTV